MRTLLLLSFALPAIAADPLEDARNAFIKGEYQKAISLAKPHVADNPLQAWRVIGACDCFLKDQAGARQAYDQLDPQGQAFLKYVCSRNAVKLP